VLHPYHGHALGAGAFDGAGQVLDDSGGLLRFAHHADLHVDDQQDCPVALAHRGHCDYLRTDD
jgi:hypothetical protein